MAGVAISRQGCDTSLTQPSRLLGLPGEFRNAIYRKLFDDIAPGNRLVSVWRKQLPVYELGTYQALVCSCRQIRSEVTSLFEEEYLPGLIWYFDALCRFHKISTSSKLRQYDNTFVLRLPLGVPPWDMIRKLCRLLGAGRFIIPALPKEVIDSWSNLRIAPSLARDSISWAFEGGHRLEAYYENRVLYRTLDEPIPNTNGIRLKFHQRTLAEGEDSIVTISGVLRDVQWLNLDEHRYVAEELMREWKTKPRADDGDATIVEQVLSRRGVE